MKIKKKRKFTSSFRCNCNDPNCGETKMAALCDWVGHDLLRVRPSQIPELFGIANTPERANGREAAITPNKRRQARQAREIE